MTCANQTADNSMNYRIETIDEDPVFEGADFNEVAAIGFTKLAEMHKAATSDDLENRLSLKVFIGKTFMGHLTWNLSKK